MRSINNHIKREMRVLSKRLLSRISSIYLLLVIGGFFIWAYTVQEPNGTLDIFKYKTIVITFLVLALVGGILAAIDFAAVGEKTSKISKRAILAGLTIGLGFLIWRILMSFY